MFFFWTRRSFWTIYVVNIICLMAFQFRSNSLNYEELNFHFTYFRSFDLVHFVYSLLLGLLVAIWLNVVAI
jgi:hypothetical protein